MYVTGIRKMTFTSGDVTATSTAAAAMSMPWWLQQLPELAAIIAAPIGIGIALLTLAIKYNEWKIKVAQLKAIEEHKTDFESIPE